MNLIATIKKLSPTTLQKANYLWQMASTNETLVDVAQRFDGVDATTAYHELKNLSDRELKLIAALIAEGNKKFDRM